MSILTIAVISPSFESDLQVTKRAVAVSLIRAIASDVIETVELCDRSLDSAVVGYFEGRSTVWLGELAQELGRSRSVLQIFKST